MENDKTVPTFLKKGEKKTLTFHLLNILSPRSRVSGTKFFFKLLADHQFFKILKCFGHYLGPPHFFSKL